MHIYIYIYVNVLEQYCSATQIHIFLDTSIFSRVSYIFSTLVLKYALFSTFVHKMYNLYNPQYSAPQSLL